MKSFHRFCLLTFMLVSNISLFAQPGSDNGGGDLEGDDPLPAPINGKLIFLAIIGTLYVFYKLKNKYTSQVKSSK